MQEEDCPIFSPCVPDEPAPSKEQTERITALLAAALKTGGDDPALAAMHERIAFLKLLFQGLCEVQHRVSAGGCRRARAHFVAAADALAGMRASADAVSPEEPASFVPSLHLSAWALPPPPVAPLPPAAAYKALDTTLSSLAAVCSITDVSSLPALKAFLTRFLDGPVPAISRAVLHTQLSTRGALEDDDIDPWAPSVHMLTRDMYISAALVSQVCCAAAAAADVAAAAVATTRTLADSAACIRSHLTRTH